MSHVRQQIREAFKTACTGLSTTASNVFQTRVYPLESGLLPGLCIYTTTETLSDSIQDLGGSSRLVSRSLSVRVEGYARATSNLDDTLDTISAEVETAVANSTSIDALLTDLELSSTDVSFTEGDREIGVITMDFGVIYTIAMNDPETAK
tara:strand:+ start:7205 stop:7654 length:450 start_codon:yes stop_codon:yes gene_type:complete